ncbi:ribonucleoside triphosphate reductase [Candidatus Gracilibacteria bacterium]|nr:MAG: ribonucleoside triphosphate reductase [Candidatus Gracilibacteria bacterium]PIE85320.1 MAG: ribonucleoside triphosphate reductase [Candidatus Gracilibacteria bacterium]
MAIYKIRKRNGSIVTFNREKIEKALTKAIKAANGKDFSTVEPITNAAITLLETKVGKNIPSVEQIQDAVEEAIIKKGHDEVAKKYILYREKRRENRTDKNVVVEVGKTMEEYLEKLDWRVNANANSGYSLGGMILNISGKITANYWLSHIYPTEIGNLHRNADFHIHDLDMFSGYCAGWSLRALLEEGFNGSDKRVDSAPAKNLQAAVNQMINFLGTLQNEWAGAQAFSSFDTYLAPFVHKYKEEIENELKEVNASFKTKEEKDKFIYDKTYKYVYQQMQNFVFGLNVPSRWGTQSPFTNITLDWTCPEDLKDKALFLGGVEKGYYKKKYGELEEEMKIINRALIDVYVKGDKNARVFTFPIPTYNITEDFPWNDPDIEALFEMTAKYGLPYFQNFIGSQYKKVKKDDGSYETIENPDAYKIGAVRSMCCRLQLDLTQLEKRGGGLFGSSEMTGSIGVVTLNMARIGYNCKGNKEAFKEQVSYLMEQAKVSLELKRKTITKWLKSGLYPYTYRYLKSFRNHFSTIGLNGMNEAILNFTGGKENISTAWGKEFATEIINLMRENLKKYQEETGNMYNLEATPAEGTTYRFAKEDKKQIPNIIQAGTKKAPYYTNSSQLPVGFTDDPFEALEQQNELQCKYTGGTVLHLYMGERLTDSKSCKNFVKTVLSNYQLPYITISPTFSICPKHGYVNGEHDYCPKCDEEIGYTGDKFDIKTRKKYTDDEIKVDKLEKTKV